MRNALEILLNSVVRILYEAAAEGSALHFVDADDPNGIMSQRDFDYFLNHYYYFNKRFLHTLGLWPSQSSKEQVLRICTVTFFQIPPLVYQLCLLFTSSFEMEWICSALRLILPALCFTCCYYTIVFNFVKVRILYSRLKFDVEHVSDEGELIIVKRYATQSKWCTMIFTFFVYFYGIGLASPSVLNVILHFCGLLNDTQLTLPIPIGRILNPGAVYYTMLLYEAMTIYVVTTTALANYATYILLVQHACSQFTIIIMKIHQPFEKDNTNIRYSWYDSAPWDEYNWIVDIIKRYTRATEFVNLTNSLSKNVYLVEIFLGLILIILNFIYMFQFSMLMQNKREALLYSTYFLGSMIIIYLNFYVGQRLLDHSSKVFLELCQVPLYRISTTTQKLLLFLMMRSMKPSALSIGGMFISSHEFFASLMQKAFSYAMACYTMR